MELTLHGKLSIKDSQGGVILKFDATGGNGASVVIPREYFQACDALRSFRSSLAPRPETADFAKLELAVLSHPFIKRVYDLTTRFNQETGLKVVIGDILDAFFVTSMKDVDEGDQPAFEARLKERLEELAPGWDDHA